MSLEFSINWNVPSRIIYNALLDQFEVSKFTRCQAVVERKVDGKYSVFDGRIHGKFISIDEANLRIV